MLYFRYVLSLCVLMCVGCKHTDVRPRWEIQISLNVETKISPETKTSGGLVLKRVVNPGSTLPGR